jgi:hypothetical protein
MGTTAKIITVLFVVLALSAGNLWAEIIEIDFTAKITWVDDLDGLLDGQINTGDIITGRYTYNSSTPATNPSDTAADYLHKSSPYGISIGAGEFVFQTDPGNVLYCVEIINNYHEEDAYLMHSYYNLSLSNGAPVGAISLYLVDSSADTLSSTALPTSVPVLEDWNEHYLCIDGKEEGSYFVFYAVITEIVPEPTTVLLLGFGGLALRSARGQALRRKCKVQR